jgi:methionine-rich copper-binding protein CopC
MGRPAWQTVPLALMLTLGAVRAAQAHAILMGSAPPIGGHVPAGLLAVSLRYNSLIDARRSRVVLIPAGGSEQMLPVHPAGAGDILVTQIAITPGHYVIRWQVLAIDGHITRGDVPFDVTQASPETSH